MPLTSEESLQLKQLLQRASHAEVEAAAASPTHESEFSIISCETFGSMSDGSKRREAESTFQPTAKRATPDMMSGSHVNAAENYVTGSTKLATPYVKMPSFSGELPPEVPDTDTWGRTIIEFGQFFKDALTYAQLHARNDEKAMSYKKWCRSRHMTAHGQLADFAKYLIHMDSLSKSSAVTQGPIIPGTSMMRRYK